MRRSEMLSANMEDYLEVIFHISEEKQAARAKDIADRMEVNKSSVTGALRSLSEKGLVNYAPYDIITLTAKGKKRAVEIVRRHEALKEFFIKILLIDPDEAEEASCRVEHAVSKNIIDRLVRFVEFMEICPRGGKEWLKGFRRHCENGDTTKLCGDHIAVCLEDLKKREQKIVSSQRTPKSGPLSQK
ncbi:MAG: metal-dependent transcriptional regulator [Desulfobacterales bacterium]|jgi:DtxR family Mn-dependent transcriptional regulator